MILAFGSAWPVSLYKSWTSRSTGGKSLAFMVIVWVGYVSGISFKFLGRFDWVVWFYLLNALMVGADIGLWFRNRRLERRLARSLAGKA